MSQESSWGSFCVAISLTAPATKSRSGVLPRTLLGFSFSNLDKYKPIHPSFFCQALLWFWGFNASLKIQYIQGLSWITKVRSSGYIWKHQIIIDIAGMEFMKCSTSQQVRLWVFSRWIDVNQHAPSPFALRSLLNLNDHVATPILRFLHSEQWKTMTK